MSKARKEGELALGRVSSQFRGYSQMMEEKVLLWHVLSSRIQTRSNLQEKDDKLSSVGNKAATTVSAPEHL